MNVRFFCYKTILGGIIIVTLDNRRLVSYLIDLKLLVMLPLLIFDIRHT